MKPRRGAYFGFALVAAAAIVALTGATPLTAPTPAASASAAPSGEQVIAKYQTAWDALKTYKVTVAATEWLNGNQQDRTYILWFEKPTHLRLDVVAGDNRGSVAVWNGGDKVYGHRGGFLSAIKLNLDIHNKMATSLRGTTIAQASFGALLDHIKAVKWKSSDVVVEGERTTLTVIVDAPDQNDGIAKEVMVFAPNWLPVELTQYDTTGTLAKHVKYSDLQLNLDIPASTWQI